MKCKDCACSDVCYYAAFNDVRAVKKRDDVEKLCKSFVHRDSIKVDAVEAVHGRWLTAKEYANQGNNGWLYCSVCEQPMREFYGWGYCPNCGADMRERKK